MGKTIQLKASDGHEFDAYVAEPAGKPRGLIVVAPEIFGANQHIRGVADGFAADGYLAIAPAFFDRVERKYETGYTQPDIAAGVEIMKKINLDDALKEVAAALEYGKSAGKAGIVGYCWGGVIAWVAASRLPGITCSVPYYGGAVPSLIDEKPKCPVMFQWGEVDASIPLEKAKAVEAAHPECIHHFYPGGHGFNCDERGSYHSESAKLARERTLEFFAKHLG
ncbi:MAG: dienelactone hydrolase family protein [Burkholderiales bacterium]